MSHTKAWIMDLQAMPEYEEGWEAAHQSSSRSPVVPEGYAGARADAFRLGWDQCIWEYEEREP